MRSSIHIALPLVAVLRNRGLEEFDLWAEWQLSPVSRVFRTIASESCRKRRSHRSL